MQHTRSNYIRVYTHSQNIHTHKDAQAGSFWRVRGTRKRGEGGGGGGGGVWGEKEQERRGGRGGRVVVAVFIDNKWWDALVSARPTEPDDRRAAERSCDRITHSGALWEVPLSNTEGGRERERGTSGEAERVGGEGNRGGRKLPMNPAVPIALFQLSCIQTNFFSLFI